MECDVIVKRCLEQLSTGFSVEPSEGGCILHTPYLDPDNDPISIAIGREGDQYIVTDMTDTMGFLFLHGIDLKPKSKQRWYLETTVRRLDVGFRGSELFATASEEELPDAIFRLLEAVRSALHLTYTAKTRSNLAFSDDVSAWLRENDLQAEERKQLIGAAGKPVVVDFVIPRAEQRPAYMYALHSETPWNARNLVNRTIVSWMELRDVPLEFLSVCLLDDTVEEDVWKGQHPLLKRYTDVIGYWDTREELIEVLA